MKRGVLRLQSKKLRLQNNGWLQNKHIFESASRVMQLAVFCRGCVFLNTANRYPY